jgi:hypothetical protein
MAKQKPETHPKMRLCIAIVLHELHSVLIDHNIQLAAVRVQRDARQVDHWYPIKRRLPVYCWLPGSPLRAFISHPTNQCELVNDARCVVRFIIFSVGIDACPETASGVCLQNSE